MQVQSFTSNQGPHRGIRFARCTGRENTSRTALLLGILQRWAFRPLQGVRGEFHK